MQENTQYNIADCIGMSMTSIIKDMNTITLPYENGIEAHGRLINIWSLLICQGTVLLSVLSAMYTSQMFNKHGHEYCTLEKSFPKELLNHYV